MKIYCKLLLKRFFFLIDINLKIFEISMKQTCLANPCNASSKRTINITEPRMEIVKASNEVHGI